MIALYRVVGARETHTLTERKISRTWAALPQHVRLRIEFSPKLEIHADGFHVLLLREPSLVMHEPNAFPIRVVNAECG